MKKVRQIFALLLLLIAAGGTYLYTQMKSGLTIKLSESQINTAMAKKFPLEKEYLLLNVTLDQPQVSLNPELDRLEVNISAQVKTPKPLAFAIGNKEIGIGKETRNQAFARIAGTIDYNPESGSFYLKDAEIVEVELNEPEAPGELQEKIRTAISFVAKQVMNRMPVYELDETQRGTKTARLLLEEIQIEDGKLLIHLKLPD